MNALPLRKDQRDELLEVLDRVIFITRSNYEAANLLVLPLAHKPNLMNELYAFACEMRRAQLNEAEIGHTKLAGNGRLDHAVSASLNDEDVGHYVDAGNGQINVAPSSSLNGNAVGHGTCAQPEGQCADAPAFPSHSNGVGQQTPAGDGHDLRATPLLPVGEDVGQNCGAVNGQNAVAPSFPLSRDGDGQSGVAARHLNSAVPYREPSQAHIRAAMKAKLRVAERVLTSLDTYVVDGKPVGDMTLAECREALDRSVERSTVLRQILRYSANAAPNMKVRQFVKAADLDAMITKARELADVA